MGRTAEELDGFHFQHCANAVFLQAKMSKHGHMGGFLKWWYPTTMENLPTKNDHFGVWNGGTTWEGFKVSLFGVRNVLSDLAAIYIIDPLLRMKHFFVFYSEQSELLLDGSLGDNTFFLQQLGNSSLRHLLDEKKNRWNNITTYTYRND